MTLRFLRAVKRPGSVHECRILSADESRGRYIVKAEKYKKVFAGWFNCIQSLVVESQRVLTSAYFVPNETISDLQAWGSNRLVVTDRATKSEHIPHLQWLQLDYDPIKAIQDVSATDEELAAALGRRDAFLTTFPEIVRHTLTGCSGNGGWAIVKIPDYPNDEEHRAIVADTVDYAAENFGADKKTKDPARCMPLPGTIKTKGDSTPSRPHRSVTVDESSLERFDRNHPFDLVTFHAAVVMPWKAAQQGRTLHAGPSAGPTSSAPERPHSGTAGGSVGGRPDRLSRAASYLERMGPAISGQNGHGQCFDAACALVLDFGLSVDDARPILSAWNQRCQPPWTTAELDHKLADANERPDPPLGRGWKLNDPRDGHPSERVDSAKSEGEARPIGQEDNPHRLARLECSGRYYHVDGWRLRFWKGEFWVWSAGAYHVLESKELRGNLAETISSEFQAIHDLDLIAAAMSEDKSKTPRLRPVTTNLVGHVVQALSGKTMVPAAEHPDQPCWLDGDAGWAASDTLPMRNAIVHLPSYLDGLPCTRKPTPRLFCPYVLGYDWNPEAPRPERWLAFLQQLWPDDRESIATLQEWMGLQLVPDMSYQKIMAFIGPPRSGKGTIGRVMQALVGPENVAGPTLSSLGLPFGLESLVGKLSAIIDDARLSGKSDQAVIAERLLSISGEGRLTVGRKYRGDWIGTLPCRITLISNELPRLGDNSGALPNRFIVLRFTRSFLGHEDTTLVTTLLSELPGILLWAIEGGRRLKARGFLQQPESGESDLGSLAEIASPIGTFVNECCKTGRDEECDTATIFLAWKQWCEANGHRESGTLAMLGRNLRTVLPELETPRVRRGKSLVRVFRGLDLIPPSALVDGDLGEAQSSEIPF